MFTQNSMNSMCDRFNCSQAMIDVSADEGWLSNVLNIIIIIQMVNQGRWHTDCPLLQLPCVDQDLLPQFKISKNPGYYVHCYIPIVIFYSEVHLDLIYCKSYQIQKFEIDSADYGIMTSQ